MIPPHAIPQEKYICGDQDIKDIVHILFKCQLYARNVFRIYLAEQLIGIDRTTYLTKQLIGI